MLSTQERMDVIMPFLFWPDMISKIQNS